MTIGSNIAIVLIIMAIKHFFLSVLNESKLNIMLVIPNTYPIIDEMNMPPISVIKLKISDKFACDFKNIHSFHRYFRIP